MRAASALSAVQAMHSASRQCAKTRTPRDHERRPSASSIFLSVLYWLSAYTDQIAAGSQPINVICRIRQMMPANGRPIVKNCSQGSSKASRRRIVISSWSDCR
ncbi:hypothetical protein X946_4897 [Burkholderia sp. ABCPW 111]|nr:hypothetical protein X946_4897 [Burkholderia sp. ABCPW 111]